MPTAQELLSRLDSRHDELLRKLDELNEQVEQTLAQFVKTRAKSTPRPQLAPAAVELNRPAD